VLAIEVVMLRHEVALLRRKVSRPALLPVDRAVLAGLSRLLSAARRGRVFVQPETLLDGIENCCDGNGPTRADGPGDRRLQRAQSPWSFAGKREPDLGLSTDPGELPTMGIRLAASSGWAILRRHGIEPTPRRSGPTWAEFLRAQAGTMLACDFILDR
jgi:putative transposase